MGDRVDAGKGGNSGTPAHVEEDLLRGQKFSIDPHGVCRVEFGVSLVERAVFEGFEPGLKPFAPFLDHSIFAGAYLGYIHRDAACNIDAVLRRTSYLMRNARTRNQGFGRRTTGVDAGAA